MVYICVLLYFFKVTGYIEITRNDNHRKGSTMQTSDYAEYIGRKMRLSEPKEKPAILIATFGSSRKGKAVFEKFHHDLSDHFPHHRIYWAYTSEIIRKKTGQPGLLETFAKVESDGFKKVVVLPLQIFPGIEYREIESASYSFPHLRVVIAETLLHRWRFIRDLLEVVGSDFYTQEEGLNLLALHGTPMVGDPANSGYLGLAEMVKQKYTNVLAASFEGVPDQDAVFAEIQRRKMAKEYKNVRIIPFVFIAGIHVEEDLMGNGSSWMSRLEALGFTVDCLKVEIEDNTYYKSLAAYPEIRHFFIDRLDRALLIMDRF